MTTIILAFPAETSQQRADRLLNDWQRQRNAGVPASERQIADDNFSRDLEIIRQCMERTL